MKLEIKVKDYLQKWDLSHPILLVETISSSLYKVNRGRKYAVLKVLSSFGQKYEQNGAIALRCFNGRGAVHLLDSDEGAHLLEYVSGASLKELVHQGYDNKATEIALHTIRELHRYSGPIPQHLDTLESTYSALFDHKKLDLLNPLFDQAVNIAHRILKTEENKCLLHGDIHHSNILKCGRRGWLAIDPQPLYGERTYEYTNLFFNPNTAFEIIENSDRVKKLADTIAEEIGISSKRVLEFAFTKGALAACWQVQDGDNPENRLRLAKIILTVMDAVQ